MRSVGLEIGDGFLRAVEVEGGPKGASIRKFVQAPVTLASGQSAEEAVTLAIDALFRDHSLPRGTVSISIDSTEATLRELSMPLTNDDQLKKTVKFEYEHHVHTKSVDDMVVDFYKIDTREKSTLVLAAGVPKAVIEHRLGICGRCRIDPVCVDLDVFALFNGAAGSGVFEGKDAAFFILIEPRSAKLLTVEEGRLRFVRNIRMAQAPRGAGSTGNEVALSTSGTYQVGGTAAIAEVLAKQISHSLLSHPLKHSVTHVIVAGVPEVVRGVVEPLQEKTTIATEAFNPDPTQPELASSGIALGLAFRGLGLDHVGTDYRQEEFKFERRYQTVKKSAFLCLCMVAVLLGLIALYFHNRRLELDTFCGGIVEEQRKILNRLRKDLEPGAAEAEIVDPVAEAKEILEKKESAIGQGDHPLPISALQRWKQVFERLTGFDHLTVQTMNINLERGTISLKGEVSRIEVAEKLVNSLKTMPDLDQIDQGRYEQSGPNQRYDWTIKLKKQG